LDYYEVRKDGGTWTTNNQLTTYTWDSLSVQSHTIEVRAIDIAGNENIISWTFEVIDNIEINKITTIDDYTYNTSQTFEWSLNSGSLDYYEIRKDGGTWTISIGSHTLEVRAIDIAGNESNIISWNFEMVDVISISNLNMINVTYPWNRKFTWTLDSGKIDHYEIRKDEGSGGVWEDVGLLPSNEYYWYDIGEPPYHTFEIKAVGVLGYESELVTIIEIYYEEIVISKVTPDFPTLTL